MSGLRYSDVKAHASAGLTALGAPYSTDLPVFDQGPFTVERRQQLTPQAMVFLLLGAGAGYAHDGIFDQPFITIRVIGRQGDFDYAEKLAYDLDTIFDLGGNATIGTAKVLYVVRTGGAPQLVNLDDADRYHFQCTYITEAQR